MLRNLDKWYFFFNFSESGLNFEVAAAVDINNVANDIYRHNFPGVKLKQRSIEVMYIHVYITHWGLVMPFGDIDLGQQLNIGSGNGLLPDGTKPLPEPMLTYHQ